MKTNLVLSRVETKYLLNSIDTDLADLVNLYLAEPDKWQSKYETAKSLKIALETYLLHIDNPDSLL